MGVQGKINLHKQVKLTKHAMTWKGAITSSFTLHFVTNGSGCIQMTTFGWNHIR